MVTTMMTARAVNTVAIAVLHLGITDVLVGVGLSDMTKSIPLSFV